MKIITQNKKALFDYAVLDTFEAGIALTGDEVKSLRSGMANLVGAFIVSHDGVLTMINSYIAPYSHAYTKGNDDQITKRTRALLMHRREIHRLIGEISRGGLTLIPLALYFNERGKVKVKVGLCKHKKSYERKEEMRERDTQRETRRELRGKYDY